MIQDAIKQLMPNSNGILGDFNKNELDYLYNLGVKSFQVGDYTKALPIFQLLKGANSTNVLYSKALAGCYHAMGDYMNALFSYKFTYLLDQDNESDCLFYSGTCLYELGKFEQAQKEFVKYTQQKNINVEFCSKAELYLESIKQKSIADNKQVAAEASS
ncbi:MAG: hypothetical protein LW807_05860 [Proteobacteria bacterium]|jgi:tetratricopeptide (TPR) repeat protein|nr:hypothetical protein [Pseudomonadota bacterium]